MNKKLIALTASLLIGGTMLGTSVFAMSNTSSGYEIYKNALLNMKSVKSMTDTIKVSASDNGKSLLSAVLTIKVNKDAKDMSGDININAGSFVKNEEIFRENDKTIVKDSGSDVYNIVEAPKGEAKKPFQKPDPELMEKRMQNVENIVDSLMGNRKSYFVLSEGNDGTKSVNVKFSENEIAPVANAILSAIVRDRETMTVNDSVGQDKIGLELPKLDKDIRISGVDVTAVIGKDGRLLSQKAALTIEGKDASGEDHSLVLNIDISISNIDSTTPDTVNLDGKQVKTITPAEFKNHR